MVIARNRAQDSGGAIHVVCLAGILEITGTNTSPEGMEVPYTAEVSDRRASASGGAGAGQDPRRALVLQPGVDVLQPGQPRGGEVYLTGNRAGAMGGAIHVRRISQLMLDGGPQRYPMDIFITTARCGGAGSSSRRHSCSGRRGRRWPTPPSLPCACAGALVECNALGLKRGNVSPSQPRRRRRGRRRADSTNQTGGYHSAAARGCHAKGSSGMSLMTSKRALRHSHAFNHWMARCL